MIENPFQIICHFDLAWVGLDQKWELWFACDKFNHFICIFEKKGGDNTYDQKKKKEIFSLFTMTVLPTKAKFLSSCIILDWSFT